MNQQPLTWQLNIQNQANATIVFMLSRSQKYEEKRRRYLAAQRGSSSSEPRVRFQGNQPQEYSVMSGHSPTLVASTIRDALQSAPDQPQNVDPRELPNAPSPGGKIQRKPGVDQLSGSVEQATVPPQEAKPASSSGPLRLPERDNLPHRQPNPTMVGVTRPDSDYARHLREQMMADVVAAQRGNDEARRPAPVAASTTPAHRGLSLPHAQPVETEDRAATMSSTIDRKAEYARQLREQMAADESTRKAMETERKSKASTLSSAVGPAIGGHEEGLGLGGKNERENESVRNAKAEYAQQLREQMVAKENAQRAAKGEMENSRSTNAGPSWIGGATEGREARRRRSNTEYAEQLRAQIAAQKNIDQGRVQPPKDVYRQQHQQLLEGVNSFEYQGGEPGRNRSRIDDQRSHGRPRTEEKTALSHGEVNNPLAIAR